MEDNFPNGHVSSTQPILLPCKSGNLASNKSIQDWSLFEPSGSNITNLDLPVDTNGLASDEILSFFNIIVTLTLNGSFGLLGMVTNGISIVVFIRQGFQDSVNISLLGLAIADVCCVTTMVWTWTCNLIVRFEPPDIIIHPMSLMMMTGNLPRLIATRLTCWMTALISVQRCLCVTLPFKIKFIFSPRNTSIMTIVIFLTMPTLYGFQIYSNRSFILIFIPWQNKSQYFMKTEDNNLQAVLALKSLCYTVLPLINLFLIILCAVVMLIRLKVSSEWRKNAGATSGSLKTTNLPEEKPVKFTKPSATGQETGKSVKNVSKEQKVTKMILTITILFIICNTPSNLIQTVSVLESKFSEGGNYQHLFYITNIVAFFMETVNSSVNLFVYYSMSSKFKLEILQIFPILQKVKK